MVDLLRFIAVICLPSWVNDNCSTCMSGGALLIAPSFHEVGQKGALAIYSVFGAQVSACSALAPHFPVNTVASHLGGKQRSLQTFLRRVVDG